MVFASKLLFQIPGSKTWTDNLDEIRCRPDQMIEVRDAGCGFKKSGTRGQPLGTIQYQFAKLKYC